MTKYYNLHPDNPQSRVIAQVTEQVKQGALIAYPTDSSYALGCCPDSRKAVAEIRKIRDLKENHPLTLVCSDISQAAEYAMIDDFAFSYLKQLTPGCYTFILPATKKVHKTVVGAKRKVVGIRIPDNPVALSLVEHLGHPLLSSSLILPGEEAAINDPHLVASNIKSVNLILDAGESSPELTTVVELIGGEANIIREGAGSLSPFQN